MEESIMETLLIIGYMVINWFLFKKMGRQGWESLIIFYASYVQFEVLYGNGWQFLTLFIPFYNIYVFGKMLADIARGFGKPASFAWGMFFMPIIFEGILAFDNNVVWLDGTYANNEEDVLDRVIDRFEPSTKEEKEMDAVGVKLKKLNDLYSQGLISEEEFTQKREELIKKI